MSEKHKSEQSFFIFLLDNNVIILFAFEISSIQYIKFSEISLNIFNVFKFSFSINELIFKKCNDLQPSNILDISIIEVVSNLDKFKYFKFSQL